MTENLYNVSGDEPDGSWIDQSHANDAEADEPLDPYRSRVGEEETEVPRREPVVWSNAASKPPLSRRMLRAFEDDGFLVLDDVFTPEEVDILKREADHLRRNPERYSPETIFTEPGAEDFGAVRSAFAIHRQLESMDALARDPRLVRLAQHILDDDVYVDQSRLNFKPAFHGTGFYWHSDFETWHVEDGMPRMRAVSMSVMLSDNHPQSGPTMFIPGSHRTFYGCAGWTPEDHYKVSLRKQELGLPSQRVLSQLVQERGLAAPAPRAGSVVVFDCNTLHGSNGNITPFERSNAFFVFNAWSNRLRAPYGGCRPRPEFLAHRQGIEPISCAA